MKLLVSAFVSILLGLPSMLQAQSPANKVTTVVSKSLWEGQAQETFAIAGRKCRVVMPDQPLTGKPWIWRPEFFDAFNQADRALLARGFHLGYIDLRNSFGCPSALDVMDEFYKHVTKTYGLANKVSLFGFSRGGLYSLNWATRNPASVACIYLDAPVCDFKSWPGGKGKGSGSPSDWRKLQTDYGFKSEQEALDYKLNPIDNLQAIATKHIRILSVCGDADTTVPYLENSAILKERYIALGGTITVIMKPGIGHHPHSLVDPAPIIEFVLAATTR